MEAKRQVYGAVGIDNLAGPSEVLVVADRTARPTWIAADLLAQEEHGSGAQAVLLAESERLCLEVAEAVKGMRESGAYLPGSDGRAGHDRWNGDQAGGRLTAFYPAPSEDFLDLAALLVNAYAPEHLELQVADPRGFLPRVRSAGAVFLGHRTPTAFGDYVAGSNHVLPTGGSARFSSPLSVLTFLRRSSTVEMPPQGVKALTPHVAQLADSEGLAFHRISAELRAAATD